MTKVLVTGASGFIAKHIVRELLDKGYAVRGTVRSEKRKAEIEALFPEAPLEFAFLDLAKDDGWAEAMQGCDILMHTASPFPLQEPKDPQELIRPAVDGTLRALKAAKAAGIKRVILTSSCAAIYKDASKPKSAPSDETHWTTADDPSVSAYEASKTLAEQAAWTFVGENAEMALTTINPGAVFGPSLDSHYGTSLELVERVMSGRDPFVPPLQLPMVDVRDVAMMHVSAIELDAAKGERFAASADTITFLALSEILRAWDPRLKAASKEAPLWLMRLLSIFRQEIRLVLTNAQLNLEVSGKKAERVFDFTYIPVGEAIIESAKSVSEHSA